MRLMEVALLLAVAVGLIVAVTAAVVIVTLLDGNRVLLELIAESLERTP